MDINGWVVFAFALIILTVLILAAVYFFLIKGNESSDSETWKWSNSMSITLVVVVGFIVLCAIIFWKWKPISSGLGTDGAYGRASSFLKINKKWRIPLILLGLITAATLIVNIVDYFNTKDETTVGIDRIAMIVLNFVGLAFLIFLIIWYSKEDACPETAAVRSLEKIDLSDTTITPNDINSIKATASAKAAVSKNAGEAIIYAVKNSSLNPAQKATILTKLGMPGANAVEFAFGEYGLENEAVARMVDLNTSREIAARRAVLASELENERDTSREIAARRAALAFELENERNMEQAAKKTASRLADARLRLLKSKKEEADALLEAEISRAREGARIAGYRQREAEENPLTPELGSFFGRMDTESNFASMTPGAPVTGGYVPPTFVPAGYVPFSTPSE